MTKIGKTFTIDLEVYNWLDQHAKGEKRKVSFIVNKALRQFKMAMTMWRCPECQANNANEFNSCHNCDYSKLKQLFICKQIGRLDGRPTQMHIIANNICVSVQPLRGQTGNQEQKQWYEKNQEGHENAPSA